MKAQLFTILSGWASKVVSAGAQVLVIRFAMEKLGEQNFGAFALLSALLPWAMLFDFGIGYSLQNFISEARATQTRYKHLIKMATLILLVIGVILTALTVFMAPSISNFYLKNIISIRDDEKSLATLCSIIIFIWTSISTVYYKILFAQHKGWLANGVPALGAAIGLLMINTIDITTTRSPLATVIILYYLPNVVLGLAVGVYVFSGKDEKGFIKINEKTTVKKFAQRACGFWSFAFFATIVLQADYWIMSQQLEGEDIVVYTILFKIFSTVLFIYSAVLQAMWPIFSELQTKKEWMHLNELIFKNISSGSLLVVLFTVVIVFTQEIIFNFMSTNYLAHASTIILFGIYILIRVWTDTYAVVLQSANKMKSFAYLVPAQAAIGILAQWMMSEKYGLNGIVIGLIASFLLTVSPGLFFVYRKYSSS